MRLECSATTYNSFNRECNRNPSRTGRSTPTSSRQTSTRKTEHAVDQVKRAGVAAGPRLKVTVLGEGELEVDVSQQGERVSAGDEVLLDDDGSFATRVCETAGAVLEDHVSRRDAGSQVHRTLFDNCRKTRSEE